jgi:hypothetical protein
VVQTGSSTDKSAAGTNFSTDAPCALATLGFANNAALPARNLRLLATSWAPLI